MFTLALLLLLGANPTPTPADGGTAEQCGARACTPPELCITVTGPKRGSSRKECWMPCPDRNACPAGLGCLMKRDVPGHVCAKLDR